MVASVGYSLTISGGASPSISYGAVPVDGYLEEGAGASFTSPSTALAVPQLEEGTRLAGTVTLTPASSTPYAIPAGSLVRLLIDGVPQSGFLPVATASWSVNTTTLTDGTHAFGVQFSTTPAAGARNGSRVYVVNNSGTPNHSLSQVIVGNEFAEHGTRCLAWLRAQMLPPVVTDPIGHAAASHPLPTPADWPRLETGNLWWAQGWQHQPTQLYDTQPMLVKNRSGDYFVSSFNPQNNDSSPDSVLGVRAWPAFDGLRGLATFSSYSTVIPGNVTMPDGRLGFLGVDLAGRICDIDIEGNVTTWFGPRSMAGQVQSSPYYTDLGLAARIAAGEKEYVGTGPFLSVPQDISIEDADTVMVADVGTSQIVYISRSQATIVRTVSLPGVTSIWCDAEGVTWAAAPAGLYKIVSGVPQLFSSISGAFWVRGDDTRGLIYVLTTSVGLYSVDRTTGVATLRNTPGFAHTFVFLTVDTAGTIGTQGNIYYAAAASYNNNTYLSRMKPGVWVEEGYFPQIQNRGNLYASEQADHDVFGHYLWGFAIHSVEAVWVSAGFSQTSWKIGIAHLGTLPTLDADIDPTVFNRGKALVGMVDRDRLLGIGEVFGQEGASAIGYSVDAFNSWDIPTTAAYLTPLLPASMSSADMLAIASYLWAQRSRKHFPPY